MCVFVNLKSTPLLADTREMLLKGHRVSGIQVLHATIPHLDMWANRLRWQVESKVSTWLSNKLKQIKSEQRKAITY